MRLNQLIRKMPQCVLMFLLGLAFATTVFADEMNASIRATNIERELFRELDPRSTVSHPDSIPLRDTALTIGTLPNGMRYYVRVSTSPAKRARLWLAVNAGSIQEDDDQRGFAHFLEHMAFNGTTHFPKNTLIDFIEHAGMQFGGDLNAYTNFDETVYQLTVPTDDRKILAQGLQVVQDWASGGIAIDSTEVVGERGVVLGEWRARNPDTASLRFRDQEIERLVGRDSRYSTRFPIGLPALLKSAQPEPIRRFYHDWYRPDLMAIIAVGDFDKSEMEREIKARFGRIPVATHPRPFVRPPVPTSAEATVYVVKDKVGSRIDVTWPAPVRPAAPMAAMRQQVLETLLFENVRLAFTRLSRQARRPFARAGIGRSGGLVRPIVDTYGVRVATSADSLLQGLATALTEVERIAQHAVSGEVLTQQKDALLRRLRHAADASASVPSKQLAAQYVDHYLRGTENLLSAQQEFELAQQILPSITPEAVAEFARFWRTGSPPTVTVLLPMYAAVQTPTRSDVLAVFDTVAKIPIALEASTDKHNKSVATLLTTIPSPGRVVKEQRYAKSKVTVWTLSNGARVIYKHTAANPDELLVQAYSLGGFSRLPDSLFLTSGRYVAPLMTYAGGVGELDLDALKRQLSTIALQSFRVTINTFNESIVLGGSPKELETMFQLMYLQFTEPKVDSTALAEWKRYGGGTLSMSANDQLAASTSGGEGEQRFTRPSSRVVSLIDLNDAMAVYRNRFGDAGDFTFAIAGAASAEQVKPLVERYIGSLPSLDRAEREQPKDYKIPPLAQKLDRRITSENVPPEKASNLIQFDGLLTGTPSEIVREQQKLSTLSWILSRRLRIRLREEMAVTYGVSAPVQFYENPQPHYRLSIQVLTAPEQMDSSVAAIWKIIDDIMTRGVTSEELSSASIVARRSTENAMQRNEWWISRLQQYDRFGMSFDNISDPDGIAMTSRDLQAAAVRYLPKKVYIQETALPTSKNIAEYLKDSKSKP